MRISDWSSDVCSSDLCPTRPRPRRCRKRARASARPAKRSLSERRPTEQPLSIDALLDDHDALALAALIRRGEVTPLELLKATIARIEARNPAVNAVVHRCTDEARAELANGIPDGPFRSEEHTSELQSLMRISYAVFC